MRRIRSRAVKGYGGFDNNARPDGWNLWVTFALSPDAAHRAIFAPADADQDHAAQLSQLAADNWVQPEFGPAPRTIWP